MVDVRLYETQTSPVEDVWLYTTTPAFTQPLSVYMHSTGAGEGFGVDVSLYTTDQWVPVDAPGIGLWLRGDMTVEGSPVKWRDQSGNSKHADASSVFVFGAFGVFGKESLFVPAGDYLTLLTLDTDGGPCTVVVVYRTAGSTAAASQLVAWYGSASSANSIEIGSSGPMATSLSLGATASVSSARVGHNYGDDNRSHALVAVRSGLSASTVPDGYVGAVDGNARQIVDSGASANTFTASVGPFEADSQVAEVIVYNRALDGVDRASLDAYLAARYVWAPTDLPDNTCVLWLRGDLGQSPTGWEDQSGNGYHATQVGGAPYEPAVGTTLINGQATARFDVNAYYNLPDVYLTTGALTYFIVYKLDAPLGSNAFGVLAYWYDYNNAFSNVALLANFAGYSPLTVACGYNTTTPGVGFGTSDLYDANAHTVSFTYDAGGTSTPANYAAFDNWLALSSFSDGNEAVITGTIGGDGLGNGMVGEIAEIIIYDGVLSARDHLSVTEYLSRRYGTLAASASGSGTISPLVASGTGSHTNGATGTGSGTLSPLVAASSGAETMTGTGSGTLSSLVAASSGTETFTGTGSGTISPLDVAASGGETFTGTGSGTLAPLVADGTGSEVFTGTGSGTISPLVAASSGTESFTGTGSGALSPLEASGSGGETFTGTGSGTLQPLDAASSGAETFTGTGSGTIAPLEASGAGEESFTGTGSGTLSPLVADGSGAESFTGSGSCAISPLVCDGSGTETITGSGSGTLQPLAADGSGSAAGAGVTGSGSGTLSPLVADASGAETMTGTGSGAIAPLVASGAGAESMSGSGSAALSPLAADGAAVETITGTGDGSISPLVADGTGTHTAVGATGTGSCALAPLDASGSGTETLTGSGGGTIAPLVADGSAVLSFVGTGSAALGPLVAASSGTSLVHVTGTGGAVLSSLDASGAGLLVISGTGSASISSLVALGFRLFPATTLRAVDTTRRAGALDTTAQASGRETTTRAGGLDTTSAAGSTDTTPRARSTTT